MNAPLTIIYTGFSVVLRKLYCGWKSFRLPTINFEISRRRTIKQCLWLRKLYKGFVLQMDKFPSCLLLQWRPNVTAVEMTTLGSAIMQNCRILDSRHWITPEYYFSRNRRILNQCVHYWNQFEINFDLVAVKNVINKKSKSKHSLIKFSTMVICDVALANNIISDQNKPP